MRVIIGSYRGPDLVSRALISLAEHVSGIDAVTIVDDSGNPEWVRQYRQWEFWPREYMGAPIEGLGIPIEVVALGSVGYTMAMGAVCHTAQDEDHFLFWEEDFVATAPIDLNEYAMLLDSRSELAQVAFLRGPHFPIEHEHGGLLEGLVARLGQERVDLHREFYENPTVTERVKGPNEYLVGLSVSLYTQLGTFTCNPSVWQSGIAAKGWPQVRWSEDAMRDVLAADGYRFAFASEIRVAHDGVRSGKGY